MAFENYKKFTFQFKQINFNRAQSHQFFICMCSFIFLFLIYFIDHAIRVVPFPPIYSPHPAHPLPPEFPPFSSCPWVIHISSLASTFPILFLTFPCLFSTYHLCYLFSVPLTPLSLSHCPLRSLCVISISVVLFLLQLFPQVVFVFVWFGC